MEKPVILVVEDNKTDQYFLDRAFTSTGLNGDAVVKYADTAEKAIQLLNSGDCPDVIVTDLHMPGIGGMGLLDYLKSDAELRVIPTIIFTSSRQQEDIRNAYEKRTNSYVVKPFGAAGYEHFAKSFQDYWLNTNEGVGAN